MVVFKNALGVLLLVFGLGLGAGVGQVVYARDYAVELIVFERPNASSTATEEIWDFSSERTADQLQSMRVLNAKAANYKTSPTLNGLAAVRNNLAASGYGILHSARWVQPAKVYQNAALISFGTANSSLPYGIIRVYKTALIFADLNIQYSPVGRQAFVNNNTLTGDATDSNLAASNLNVLQPHFFMSEKRRLKFKQIHYFDHPLFGAILGVWPSP